MFHSVKIDGYRGFANFEMTNLGRVNLLVGKNNSGKTSVLEALHLLSYGGDISALWQICGRRGERISDERDPRYPTESEIDISHLFLGHEIAVGSKFTISARNQSPMRAITYEISEPSQKEREQVGAVAPVVVDEPAVLGQRLVLRVHSSPPMPSRLVPLTRRGGISIEFLDAPRRVQSGRRVQETPPSSHFISTESLNGSELARLWDKVQLRPQEKLVLEALRFIDPKIDQIRAVGSARYIGDRGGFLIKREDYNSPFPLGSLGDGAWRMLALAIVITQCSNGVLLIDEIDTGLHYTVMADMWKMIHAAAKEFDVQVFATTHSYDCVHSIATVCHESKNEAGEITIQRIESGRNKAVAFTDAQVSLIAERDIEVR
jgi:energy-coupling factor transporter ATP-binding protein EcfA2